jgi:hypothetical protein
MVMLDLIGAEKLCGVELALLPTSVQRCNDSKDAGRLFSCTCVYGLDGPFAIGAPTG